MTAARSARRCISHTPAVSANGRSARTAANPCRRTQTISPSRRPQTSHTGDLGSAPVEKLLAPPPPSISVTRNRRLQSLLLSFGSKTGFLRHGLAMVIVTPPAHVPGVELEQLTKIIGALPLSARPCLQTADISGLNSYLKIMRRGDLTDEQWHRLEPLLPDKPHTGRPNEDPRQILTGILWIHRTGAPWRDLPRRYGPVGPVSSRFYRWRKAGIWQRILSDLQAEAEQRGEIDWD